MEAEAVRAEYIANFYLFGTRATVQLHCYTRILYETAVPCFPATKHTTTALAQEVGEQ